MSNGGRSRAAIIGCLLVALLALAGCGEGSDGPPGATGQGKRGGPRGGGFPGVGGTPGEAADVKTPVVTGVAGRADMQAFLDASSTLMAEDAVDVVSQATGVAVELLVEEGDRVRKDQLLVRLDYEELELAERRARADLDKLEADYARAETLAGEDLLSEEDYQQVRFDLNRAQIDWQQRKLELERTKILSPITGTITSRQVNVGQLVQQNAVVFHVVDFDSLVAPAFIPEKYLGNLRVGQRARIEPRGFAGETVGGAVERISPVVDSQSGTVKVTVAIDRRSGLRPGMFANVQLVLDVHEDTVVIPKKALVFDDELPHAFVVEEGTAYRRQLELGYQDAHQVEVLAGLDSGDTIVLVGQSALRDGSAVIAQTEGGTPGEPGAGPGAGPTSAGTRP